MTFTEAMDLMNERARLQSKEMGSVAVDPAAGEEEGAKVVADGVAGVQNAAGPAADLGEALPAVQEMSDFQSRDEAMPAGAG